MKSKRVLVVVDEMAQLGAHMKSLENAMGMAAGAAGLQLWCVLQDLSQLKGMFPQTWETFIQNCGVTLWFGARDQTTREYVSKLAGTCDVFEHMAKVSGGVYTEFKPDSGAILRELLATVAVFSAAGHEGLKQVGQPLTPEARQLRGSLLLTDGNPKGGSK